MITSTLSDNWNITKWESKKVRESLCWKSSRYINWYQLRSEISFLDYKGFEFQATKIEYLKCLVISLHYGGPYLNCHTPIYLKQKKMENLESSQILCDINHISHGSDLFISGQGIGKKTNLSPNKVLLRLWNRTEMKRSGHNLMWVLENQG